MDDQVAGADDSIFGPVIHAYTRAQALEDGVLVDVSETAREAGITFPVALTRAVFTAYVEVPRGCEGFQDVRGRLWDVVWMLRDRIRRSKGGETELAYRLRCVIRMSQRGRMVSRDVVLRSRCGPGDEGEPVITVMLPEED